MDCRCDTIHTAGKPYSYILRDNVLHTKEACLKWDTCGRGYLVYVAPSERAGERYVEEVTLDTGTGVK